MFPGPLPAVGVLATLIPGGEYGVTCFIKPLTACYRCDQNSFLLSASLAYLSVGRRLRPPARLCMAEVLQLCVLRGLRNLPVG